jgi:hypothetical protein
VSDDAVRHVAGDLVDPEPGEAGPAAGWEAVKDVIYDRVSGETVALAVGSDPHGHALFIARAPAVEAAALVLLESVGGQDRRYPPSVSWEALDAVAAALGVVIATADVMEDE